MDDSTYDIALIGGGASGTLVAIHLLRQARAPTRVALVEPGTPGRGVAYGTDFDEHLLNVPAARMSVDPDAPSDFLDYLQGVDAAATAATFAPRRVYAAYLADRFAAARVEARHAMLDVVPSRVVDAEPDASGVRLRLDDGRVLRAAHAVIALGNTPRPLPVAAAPGRVVASWDYAALKAIDAGHDVTIVGAGHSMVDVVLSLSAQGHRGRIDVLSRTARLPLPHARTHGACDFDATALLPLPLRARLRTLRKAMHEAAEAGVSWQDVMDRVRPQVRALWATLDDADRRRFLRHVVRSWDVHRHRIAPHVHDRLEALRRSGQLTVHRGRLQSVEEAGGQMRVQAAAADGQTLRWSCDVLVNAVGLQTQATRMGHAVLDALFARGDARPGPLGIGLDTDADAAVLRADGNAQARLHAIGSLRIGTLWETIAVPELRQDAQALAMRLLASSASHDASRRSLS